MEYIFAHSLQFHFCFIQLSRNALHLEYLGPGQRASTRQTLAVFPPCHHGGPNSGPHAGPLDSNTREVTTAVLSVSIVNCFTAVQDRHCRVSLLCWQVKDTVAKTTRFKASHCSGISLAQHSLLLRSSKPKVWHPDLIRTVQNQFI